MKHVLTIHCVVTIMMEPHLFIYSPHLKLEVIVWQYIRVQDVLIWLWRLCRTRIVIYTF